MLISSSPDHQFWSSKDQQWAWSWPGRWKIAALLQAIIQAITAKIIGFLLINIWTNCRNMSNQLCLLLRMILLILDVASFTALGSKCFLSVIWSSVHKSKFWSLIKVWGPTLAVESSVWGVCSKPLRINGRPGSTYIFPTSNTLI